MTKQEIKDLIAAKIAGQGSAVDVGGALPVILNAILENAGTPETAYLGVDDGWSERQGECRYDNLYYIIGNGPHQYFENDEQVVEFLEKNANNLYAIDRAKKMRLTYFDDTNYYFGFYNGAYGYSVALYRKEQEGKWGCEFIEV